MRFESQSPEDTLVAPAHRLPNDEESLFAILSGRRRATGGWDWRVAKTRRTERWSDPGTWWRAIDAAISWLAMQVIEGFAACGAAAYPGCFGSEDNSSDCCNPAESSPHRQYAGRVSHPQEDQTLVTTHCKPADLSQFGAIQHASPAWRRWIRSRVAERGAAMRRERDIRRAISALEAMDDRALRDAGIGRCEIEQVVRHGSYRS
jgi:uncharacterized protein YjiS (DUF1127 family)